MFRILARSARTGIVTDPRPARAAAAPRLPRDRLRAVHRLRRLRAGLPDGSHRGRARRCEPWAFAQDEHPHGVALLRAVHRLPRVRPRLPRGGGDRRERVRPRRLHARAAHAPRLVRRGPGLRTGDASAGRRACPAPRWRSPREALAARIRGRFGRSLHVRQVDAGSCNGCELEIAATANPVFDLERFGIHFVASPRHADLLLVTGPVTRNMEIALLRTLEATPEPRVVVAVGACGCSGGIFGEGTYASLGGVDRVVPVDVYVPGCPPPPQAILAGLFVAMGIREARAHPEGPAAGAGSAQRTGVRCCPWHQGTRLAPRTPTTSRDPAPEDVARCRAELARARERLARRGPVDIRLLRRSVAEAASRSVLDACLLQLESEGSVVPDAPRTPRSARRARAARLRGEREGAALLRHLARVMRTAKPMPLEERS